jgi:hypothetical protein
VTINGERHEKVVYAKSQAELKRKMDAVRSNAKQGMVAGDLVTVGQFSASHLDGCHCLRVSSDLGIYVVERGLLVLGDRLRVDGDAALMTSSSSLRAIGTLRGLGAWATGIVTVSTPWA